LKSGYWSSPLGSPTRDLSGRVRFFLIVHGQREECLTRPHFPVGDRGAQHHRIAHADVYRTGRLFRNPVSLENDLVVAKLKFLFDGIQCLFLFLIS
jgi:hypothetical protein